VENGKIILNDIGKIVEFTWLDLTQYNANIELDQFIVMPNHVHGIIIVGAGSKSARVGHGLSEIVRQFKTFSAKRVNRLHRTSGMCFWQRNYYEHVIRSDAELTNMCRYIVDNPQQWGNDIENTDNDTGGFRTRPYTDIFC
jgi:REP element-mobilizing transposase RayT